ncbi:MAG TPA: DUF547 domain-containing protein [Opitutaceae bacterium]|jgi:hypothetical protein|nr:DUF547 domain-containing protein [Opitutaceae bacterium]
MRRLLLAVVLSLPGLGLPVQAAAPDHALFTQILTTHVQKGLVDYDALARDERLTRYLAQIAATEPETLTSDNEKLAFWLNAYNAYTLKLILERRPNRSIQEIGPKTTTPAKDDKTSAWDIRFAQVGRRTYTLNEMEHEVIRRTFRDARVHFALNCASGSCPELRPEAYEAETLGKQLDDQGRQFLADNARNRFDLETKTAWLSSIFDWYRRDFGESERTVLRRAAQYAPEAVRTSIQSNPEAWTVKYLDYDWTLNAKKP